MIEVGTDNRMYDTLHSLALVKGNIVAEFSHSEWGTLLLCEFGQKDQVFCIHWDNTGNLYPAFLGAYRDVLPVFSAAITRAIALLAK